MSKVDWSKAPEGAEFYSDDWYKSNSDGLYLYQGGAWNKSVFTDIYDLSRARGEPCKKPPEVATGEHDQFVGTNEMVEAQDFLSEGLKILGERGRQYGSNGRECSFSQVAQAFNAITGNSLKGSDVCLILSLVKQVRQYAQPERFHEDSAVDGVNYTALQAQELKKERK